MSCFPYSTNKYRNFDVPPKSWTVKQNYGWCLTRCISAEISLGIRQKAYPRCHIHQAFYGCTSLTSIVVEEGNITYDSRDGCNAIIETVTNELILGCKSTIIPSSVTAIGDEAFYGWTSLTSVEIPSSVTVIGYSARLCSYPA